MSVSESTIGNPKKQLEFYKDLSEQLQQENQQLKEQLKKAKESYEKESYIVDKLTRQLTDEYKNTDNAIKKLQQRDEVIDELTKHIQSLSSKGRDCMIYADVKKDILDILKKYKKVDD